MTQRERPVLVFDGDCGFCTRSVRFVERRIPVDAEIVQFQAADLESLGTSVEQTTREIVWVAMDGRTYGGAQAAAKLLIAAGGPWRPIGLLGRIPPFRWIAHGLYRAIAANRYRLPGGTAACAVPRAHQPGAAA